MPEIEFGAFQP